MQRIQRCLVLSASKSTVAALASWVRRCSIQGLVRKVEQNYGLHCYVQEPPSYLCGSSTAHFCLCCSYQMRCGTDVKGIHLLHDKRLHGRSGSWSSTIRILARSEESDLHAQSCAKERVPLRHVLTVILRGQTRRVVVQELYTESLRQCTIPGDSRSAVPAYWRAVRIFT